MNIEKLIEAHGFDVHGGCPGREPLIAIKESDLRALFKDKVLVPVELLRAFIRDIELWPEEASSAGKQLRAIIDNKGQK